MEILSHYYDTFSKLRSAIVSVDKAYWILLLLLMIITIINYKHDAVAQPLITDPSLQAELIFTGIKFPTSMAFLGPNDILVLEKNEGTVRRIINGNMIDQPLLDVNVANERQRGMLGIAISKDGTIDGNDQIVYVFLYYSETRSKDGEDAEGGDVLGNRLYRYELRNNSLINERLLLDLPGGPGVHHTGGVVLIGPDRHVYLVVGAIDHLSQAQNILEGSEPDGTSAILRISQDGKVVQDVNMLGDKDPLNKYYAYGIRSSFGLDFDPLTGNLWDTENGDYCCDEINLVEKGFNSGWNKVQGVWSLSQTGEQQIMVNDSSTNFLELVTFDGKGKYSSPELSWNYVAAPTALKFLTSDNLGKQYRNDMFVGNFNEQILYHFDLSENRRELLFKNTLPNKTAENSEDLEAHIFGKEFGRITDLDVGPDGNLYVLSHEWNPRDDYNYGRTGSIFKIFKPSN